MEDNEKQLELLARHKDYLPFHVEQLLGGNEKRYTSSVVISPPESNTETLDEIWPNKLIPELSCNLMRGNSIEVTVTHTTNRVWNKENRPSPCKDGRRDVHLQAFSNTAKIEEVTDQTKTLEKTVGRTIGTVTCNLEVMLEIIFLLIARGTVTCNLEVMLEIIFLLIARGFLARYRRKQEAEAWQRLKKMLELAIKEKDHIKRMQAEAIQRFEEMVHVKIKDIEGEETITFLITLLFYLTENINEIIKSKQTRCRKYPCLNSILYLLWRSGDVEENPGPPANSITYRNWLYDVCSVVRKATVGVSPYCKIKNIWKQQPDNWPPGELYFDPRNSNKSIHKVEAFLQIILHCFDPTRQLPHDIKSEIDAWKSDKSKDNSQLLNLYTRRVCFRSTAQSMTILQSHISVDEVLEFKLDNSIIVKVSRQPATDQYVIAPKHFRADTTRKIASYLCRIFHGKDPEQKCDHIWKETPVGWPSGCRFYNPYNGGKRCAENEDTRLVRELITLCEKKSIFLPKPYKDMIKAWLADDQALLSKLITRQTAEIGIKNALRKLQEGGLLRDSQVAKQLKELGLFVQSTTSIKITKSQKRKMANATTTSKVKRTRIQYDEEEGLDATLKELLPECSIVELLDKSDSHLLDMISPKLSNGFLDDETDDIQCQ